MPKSYTAPQIELIASVHELTLLTPKYTNPDNDGFENGLTHEPLGNSPVVAS